VSERLPVLKAREVIRILERSGFYIHHQTGSHVQMKRKEKPDIRITIPFHAGDLPRSLLRTILKQAQLSLEEFNALR
jgi:predicted RNA binding protein YcfA (HicA-like mRNA interferase family)